MRVDIVESDFDSSDLSLVLCAGVGVGVGVCQWSSRSVSEQLVRGCEMRLEMMDAMFGSDCGFPCKQ